VIYFLRLFIQVIYSKKMSQQQNLEKVPLVILILENSGNISYRAYSPLNYPTPTSFEQQQDFIGQFHANVYNSIAYNSSDFNNSTTNMGNLKEIHTRLIDIHPQDRGQTMFFTVYDHPHCQYHPVHRPSPVFFNQDQAFQYQESHPNLIGVSCYHSFL
jgi:hypothetical protein